MITPHQDLRGECDQERADDDELSARAARLARCLDNLAKVDKAVLGFAAAANLAALVAWSRAFRRKLNPIWEPTRRPEQVAAGEPRSS